MKRAHQTRAGDPECPAGDTRARPMKKKGTWTNWLITRLSLGTPFYRPKAVGKKNDGRSEDAGGEKNERKEKHVLGAWENLVFGIVRKR